MDEIVNCINCGAVIPDDDIYCTKCGTHKPVPPENFCNNAGCINHRKGIRFDAETLYCGKCGKPTTIGEKVINML